MTSPETVERSTRDEEYVDCGNMGGESEHLLHDGQYLLQSMEQRLLDPLE